MKQLVFLFFLLTQIHQDGVRLKMSISNESVQVNRAISTGKLNASPRLHTRPIDVVVYHGSI